MNKDIKEVYLAFLSGEYEFRIYKGRYQGRWTKKSFYGPSDWHGWPWFCFPLIDEYLIGPVNE